MKKSKFAMNPIFIDLAVGEKREWTMGGEEFHCRKIIGGNELQVSFDAADSFIPIAEREGFKIPHDHCVLFNDSLLPISIQCYQPSETGIYVTPAQQGELDVFGNVTTSGQPLTTDGGSITPLGESKHAVVYTADPSSRTIPIVTGAANTNGVAIRTANLIETVGGSTNSLGTTGIYFERQRGAGTLSIQREYFVPAGEPFNLIIGINNALEVHISYDIL